MCDLFGFLLKALIKKGHFCSFMSELIYVDTCVWISLFKEEKDSLRPLSEFSFELFRKALDCEYDILVSNWLLNELEKKGFLTQTNELITQFKLKNKIKTIHFTKEDINKAKKNIHWHDRLHEILAKKGNAQYLVTRNLVDFNGDLLQIKLPENL